MRKTFPTKSKFWDERSNRESVCRAPKTQQKQKRVLNDERTDEKVTTGKESNRQLRINITSNARKFGESPRNVDDVHVHITQANNDFFFKSATLQNRSIPPVVFEQGTNGTNYSQFRKGRWEEKLTRLTSYVWSERLHPAVTDVYMYTAARSKFLTKS